MEPAANHAAAPGQASQRGRAWAILAVCMWGYLFSAFYRVSVAVISPQLASELELSAGQLSDVSAAFFYGMAMSQIPLGLAVDRWGTRKMMGCLTGLAICGTLVFALATSAAGLVLGRVLMGLGMSCNLMGTMLLIGAWFPVSRFATLSGAIIAMGAIGNLSAATPLVLLSQAVGWRGAFALVAGFNALQGLALWLVVRDHPPGAAATAAQILNPFQGWGELLKQPFFWVISLASCFRYGCFNVLQALWAGPFVIYGLGFSVVQAGNALLFMGVGYMVGLPLCGRLSDRILATRKWVALPGLWVSALLTLGLGWLEGAPIWVLYLLFMALGAASAPGQIMYPHIKELLPQKQAARALTGINFYTMLGAAGVMQAAGLLVQGEPATMSGTAGYWPLWIALALALGAAGLAYLFIPDSQAIKKSRA